MSGELIFMSRMCMAVFCLIGAAVLSGSCPVRAASMPGAESPLRTAPILIGKRTIQAKVADTDLERRQGLLGWSSISEDTGMLLDFGSEGKYAIHVEGMQFPIDAVWIDHSGEIKLVYEDIQPNSGELYHSMVPCRYCLELKAGFCRKFKVKTGARIKLGAQAP